MTKGTLEIHSKNILPIIKKWLYTDKDIFIRELISNACDAIHKRKVLQDQGEANKSEDEPRIDLVIDKENKTLTFKDNGIGMDESEVVSYLSQVAFSSAEEFVKKYQSDDEKDQIIGHFGLGFYSAYMVAKEVVVESLSYKEEASPVKWSCDGNIEYEIEKSEKSNVGTTITLHVSDEEEEYLEEARIKHIMQQYCRFLHFPIYLNGEHFNNEEPLWLKSESECTPEDYLNFYQKLHPGEEAPLFWIHLNVDYPFNLKGILYFPKLKRDYDWKNSSVQLYCNRVFVSDSCKDLIPEYLLPLKGAIDSPDIPLNVSRSTLQIDRTVRQLSAHISKRVADQLKKIEKEDRERYLEVWPDIQVIVKYGAYQDPKFYDRTKDLLIWKSNQDEWTNVENYLEKNKQKHENKVFYTQESQANAPFMKLYKQKEIDVLLTHELIDPAIISFLEQKNEGVTFQRVDGALDEALLDKEKECSVVDSEGKTRSARLADFIKGHLGEKVSKVEAKSLASSSIPAMIVIDEHSRRLREFMKRYPSAESSGMGMGEATLVVNTNSPMMESIEKIGSKDPELAKEMLDEVYDLCRLSQSELDPQEMPVVIERTFQLLEKLSKEKVS